MCCESAGKKKRHIRFRYFLPIKRLACARSAVEEEIIDTMLVFIDFIKIARFQCLYNRKCDLLGILRRFAAVELNKINQPRVCEFFNIFKRLVNKHADCRNIVA